MDLLVNQFTNLGNFALDALTQTLNVFDSTRNLLLESCLGKLFLIFLRWGWLSLFFGTLGRFLFAIFIIFVLFERVVLRGILVFQRGLLGRGVAV